MALAPAASADQGLEDRGDLGHFDDCPIGTEGPDGVPLGSISLGSCIKIVTNSGEVKLGSKTTEITRPVVLQGGLHVASDGSITFEPAVGGPTFEGSPETVPGGLTGIQLRKQRHAWSTTRSWSRPT